MDDAHAEHLDHLAKELLEVGARRVGVERDLTQPGRREPVLVSDELHDQHAVDEMIWRRNPHTRRVQAMDDVHLGRFPRLLFLRLTVPGPPLDGALVA